MILQMMNHLHYVVSLILTMMFIRLTVHVKVLIQIMIKTLTVLTALGSNLKTLKIHLPGISTSKASMPVKQEVKREMKEEPTGCKKTKQQLLQELLELGAVGQDGKDPNRFSKAEMEELLRQAQRPTTGMEGVVKFRTDPCQGLTSYSKGELVELATYLGHPAPASLTCAQLTLWIRMKAEELDHQQYGQGKFRNLTYREICLKHPSYCEWGSRENNPHSKLAALIGLYRMYIRFYPKPRSSAYHRAAAARETPLPTTGEESTWDHEEQEEEIPEQQLPIPPKTFQAQRPTAFKTGSPAGPSTGLMFQGIPKATQPRNFVIRSEPETMDTHPPLWQEKKPKSASTQFPSASESEGYQQVEAAGGIKRK